MLLWMTLGGLPMTSSAVSRAVVCGDNSMVCGCMGKSLVCIGYVSHLLYVGLVYRVGYSGFKAVL